MISVLVTRESHKVVTKMEDDDLPTRRPCLPARLYLHSRLGYIRFKASYTAWWSNAELSVKRMFAIFLAACLIAYAILIKTQGS